MDGKLYFGSTVAQAVDFLVAFFRVSLLRIKLSYGAAQSPELRVVGVRLEAPFVGERKHFVVHSRGVAYP